MADAPQYLASGDGLVQSKEDKAGNPYEVPLTNFVARIIAETERDAGPDSPESEHLFTVQVDDVTMDLTAEEFSDIETWSMKFGARNTVYPKKAADAKAAIKLTSVRNTNENGETVPCEIPKSKIYVHTGWTEHDGQQVFITGDQVIGKDGPVEGIKVDLGPMLSKVQLPEPPTGERFIKALQAQVRLLQLYPRVTIPLVAYAMSMVVARCDFSLWLAGQTGAFKTALAVLQQQHFGKDLNENNLLASWEDTANALERTMHFAKDVVVLVDDYVPRGTLNDLKRLQATADRLIRGIANRQGRNRLNQDATMKGSFAPRAGAVITGEDVPEGQSTVGRMLTMHLQPGRIRTDLLSQCQKDADDGLYAEGTAAFVRYIAGAQPLLGQLFEKLAEGVWRRYAGQYYEPYALHAQTPAHIAWLLHGMQVWLMFVQWNQAITFEELEDLWSGLVEPTLKRLGLEQQQQHAASDPSAHYLAMIAAAITSGEAHVARPDGNAPQPATTARLWGWRPRANDLPEAQGDCIGWLDGEDLYLDPDLAHKIVLQTSAQTGAGFKTSKGTVHKRLNEAHRLVTVDGPRQTLTVRRTLEGARRNVLHLRAADVFQAGAELDQ